MSLFFVIEIPKLLKKNMKNNKRIRFIFYI